MSCFHMPTIVDVYKNDNLYQMLTSRTMHSAKGLQWFSGTVACEEYYRFQALQH